jgi:hypothetical protein
MTGSRIQIIPKEITVMRSRMKLFAAFCIIFAGLVLPVFAAVAAANNGERPCANDIAKFCSDVKPGGGRILGCLQEHRDDLSASCRDRIANARERRNMLGACRDDAAQFCRDVRPGGGRIIQCLREHSSGLSGECGDAVSHGNK